MKSFHVQGISKIAGVLAVFATVALPLTTFALRGGGHQEAFPNA